MNWLSYPLNGPEAVVVDFYHKKWLATLTYLQLVVSFSCYFAAAIIYIRPDDDKQIFDYSGIWAVVPTVAGACIGVAAVRQSTWPLMMTYLVMSAFTCVASQLVLGFAVWHALDASRHCAIAVTAGVSGEFLLSV